MSTKSSPAGKTPTSSKPKPRSPNDVVRAALVSLSATRDGFEGLTGSLIDAATGGSLRLLASGDQLGVDGIADPVGTGPRRAMQSKRYKPSTSLGRTSLLGEMAAAQEAWPGIDSWVLASTQALQGIAARSVRAFAESSGWGFAALDWSAIAPRFPRLATLCAAYIDIACDYEPLAKVRPALETIAAAPGFPAARDTLIGELMGVDTGFAAARTAGISDIERIFHDPAIALAIAGPSPALLAQAPPVSRQTLRAAVTNWWKSDVQTAVLLGVEGMGKTWGALDAVRHLASEDGGPLPIVISSTRAGQAADGYAALIGALVRIGEAAQLRVANPELFWRRRLALWSRAGAGAAPRLLVLVDGLDEIDPFDWAAWLAPLRSAENAGLVRLLLSCRPDEWRHRIAIQGSNIITELEVGLFLAEERDAYLTSRGVVPVQVSAEVLEAALHPRTAFHLTRLADELGDLTRITREQLLLRDFENLCQIKGGPIGPAVFEALVRELAERAQAAALAKQAFSITTGAVLDAAADLSGDSKERMRRVLGDLVSGAWIERDPDNPTRFGFTDKGLPDAVGLALASMIRRLDVDVALDEIDRFLEPWRADDLVEKVLRTCATVLVTDYDVPDMLCRAVLERWHAKPTHGSGGQDFWRRLHIFRPALFLDFCAENAGRGDWLCEWGVACFWEDHVSVRPLIEARLHDWLTTIALPAQGASSGSSREDENRRRYRQLARLRNLENLYPQAWKARIGLEESMCPADSANIAARVIGFLPRLPFIGLIRDWAINCAAAGRLVHATDIEALMRDLDATDGEEAVISLREIASALEASGSDMARTAAAHLLRLAGDSDDAVHANELLPQEAQRPRQRAIRRIDTLAGQCLARDHTRALRPLALINALTGDVGDPDIVLDPELAADLGAAAAALKASDVPHLYEQEGRPATVLLRWHPSIFYALLHSYLLDNPLPEEDHALADYRRIAIGALPIIDADARATIADRLDVTASEKGNGRGAAAALRLARLSLAEQIALLLGQSLLHWPRDYRFLLNDPVANECETLVVSIDFTAAPEDVRARLALALALAERCEVAEVERDWIDGYTHSDPEIRYEATRLARLCGGSHAVQQFEPLGFGADTAEGFALRFETGALLSKLDDTELRPRLSRLGPESLAHAYLNRPALRADVLPLWQAWVRDRLATVRKSWGIGAGSVVYADREDAYRAYVEAAPDEVAAFVREVWANKVTRNNIRFDHGDGPAWPLLEALAPVEPDLVKSIWRDIDGRPGIFAGHDPGFPARLPPGPLFDDLRRDVLERPRTDERLFGAVRAFERHGRRDFVLQWIEKGLTATIPAERARAITVAGFLDASEEAVALWAGPLGTRPAAGWLGDVYDTSKAWFECARHSRHWYRAMREAADEEQALRAFWLLNRVSDARVWLFFKTEPYHIPHDSWRVQWLDFYSKAVTKLREAPVKEIKNSFLHGERMNHTLNHY